MRHYCATYHTSILKKVFFSLFILVLSFQNSYSQEQELSWLTFEQLEDSLAITPKKVFVSFYADWCAYCKKMDQVAFKDSKVINTLNSDYYAVKMDAESLETVAFDGKVYENKQRGLQRNPKHELALLLASQKGQPFTLPAIIMLNEEFEVTQRYFSYLSAKALYIILKQ